MPLAVFPKCFIADIVERGTMTVEDWVDRSAALDVDGLEFYWPFVPWQDEGRVERLRARVAAQGRSIPMMCASPDFTQPEPDARQREVNAYRRVIQTSAALGVSFCRVLSGQRRPGVTRVDGVRWAAESIRALLPDAERAGVRLVLENHYKDAHWTYPEFAQRPEDFFAILDRIAQRADVFLELVAAVGESPWFGVNYDPSNALVAGDDPYALLEAVRERVFTMHASDRYLVGGTLEDLRRAEVANPGRGYADILRHGATGRGLNDFDRLFATLRAAGFRGWVSIEDGDDPVVGMEDLAASAAFLRPKMRAHGL